METSVLATLFVGFLLGLRHATDADHVVAVATLVSDAPGARRAARVGALWGLGHLLTVLAAGSIIVLLRAQVSPRVEWALELGVAFVLIGLGVHTIGKCFRGRYHFHAHQHGAHEHAHLHYHASSQPGHEHTGPARRSPPLLLGMVHGLAGTAGLALLVLTSIPSRAVGIAYLLFFGAGALAGMAAFGALLGMPLARAARRLPLLTALRFAAGAASAAFGAVLSYRATLPGAWPF